MIEELDDIIEELANKCDIYGADKRPWWTADLKRRIVSAIEIEQELCERGRL